MPELVDRLATFVPASMYGELRCYPEVRMHRQFSRGIASTIIPLGALAAAGCGGDNATAPSLPDVSGIYETVVNSVADCDPASALDVLEVALSSGTLHGKVR